ncbi:MAG: cytochrome c [Gammaproteobacteria bacterium]|nr:cytochrome c [Gammaproteobacteria bacterium]
MKSMTLYTVATAMLLAGPLLLPVVAWGDTAAQGPDEASVELRMRGARSWVNNCARCHNMRAPQEFRDDQWKPIVAHMRIRGGLTGQEARAILTFLQSAN